MYVQIHDRSSGEREMIERFVMAKRKRVGRLLRSPARACLTLMVLFGTGLFGQTTNGAKSSASDPAARATHILGMESISKGANGRHFKRALCNFSQTKAEKRR